MSSKLDQISDWESRIASANFRVDALAKQCGVSERKLRKYIEQELGVPPHLWLIRLRLETAPELLRNGFSAKEVAAKLLFRQQAHFTRVFKLVYGKPPAAFVKSYRKMPD